MQRRFCAALVLISLGASCDRGVAPFDPSEEPAAPDLAKIFPDQTSLRGTPQQRGATNGGSPPRGGATNGGSPPQGGATNGVPGSPRVGDSGAPVRGQIRIAQELVGQIPGDALLFIIARPPGAGPPLAVKRIEGPTFPLDFEVGPWDRMIAERPFAGPFALSAWIDSDGNVMTRGAGDYQGQAEGSYGPGDDAIEITIDEAL